MVPNERRQALRIRVEKPVYYELDGQTYRGVLRDVSAGGAFVLTSVAHALQGRIRLLSSGAGGASHHALQTWGRIRRMEPEALYEGASWPGFALCFEPDDREALGFVETLASSALRRPCPADDR
jgi:hypothetical protein